ncbi:MAG: amino acid permease [Selenomonadaceae bacterium]|nr:amino acid permease [Selenomonadaceae bacterium]
MEQRNFTPVTLWALAFGCCIGWGSFMMPGTTFLPTAGTAGTTIAILLGALVMILIAYNYHFVMQRNSSKAGGVFTFTKELFGYDHAFFCAWFLWIAYLSLLWANATAVTLMERNLFGGVLQIGFHYIFAGYDVYGGEVVVTLCLLFLFGILFAWTGSLVKLLVKIAAVTLFFGVIFCYVSAVNVAPEAPKFFFVENESPLEQIFIILALIPWAFIGFETISQYTNEYKKISGKAFVLMVAAIICAAVVYILMTSLATLQYPEQFRSSATYIASLENFSGLWRVPTFYVVTKTFGGNGIAILCVVISSALITSMIGYYYVVSGMTQTFAKENILPKWFASRRHAVLFILMTSLAVPFCGRTVVGWLTDVTTIGATIAYGYTSACAYVLARREKNRRTMITGVAGIICAVAFTIFLLIPNLWSINVLAEESYFILAIWGLLGFAYFNYLFKHDEKKFGTSATVWLVMFFLVFFSSLMWMREKMHDELKIFIQDMNQFYSHNTTAPRLAYTNMQISKMRDVLLNNTMILLIFAVAGLGFLFTIYRRIQNKKMVELEEQKLRAEESSRAKSTFLSNMSHDIRTPMNAIIGYTTLAKRDDMTKDALKDFIEKIDVSGKHLLDLINDILEMSRIESGRMDLELAEVNLKEILNDLQTMFHTQMTAKGISFSVDASHVRHPFVNCDKNRFNRVLLNLVGNAYKFTPSGKSVAVTLNELDDGNFELHVKDTGIGMSAEFAKKIFQAFERERTSTVSGIQGTGLGTAITKSIVDLMGGTIDVVTEKNVGTEFIVRVAFEIIDKPEVVEVVEQPAQVDDDMQSDVSDFTGKKLLLVEDIEVNREIAMMLLEQFGFEIDTAINGQDALDKATKNSYDLILMDIQMPVMNGYESSRAIRAAGSRVPIVAMTANAMPEDIKKAHDAGMNDHIAKPLDVPKMMATIANVLQKKF